MVNVAKVGVIVRDNRLLFLLSPVRRSSCEGGYGFDSVDLLNPPPQPLFLRFDMVHILCSPIWTAMEWPSLLLFILMQQYLSAWSKTFRYSLSSETSIDSCRLLEI